MNKYFWLKLLLFWDSISVYSSFNLTLLNGINNDKIQVPSDIKQFLFDYKHSKFIECNKEYAKESVKKMGNNYTAGELQILKAQNGLVYVKSILEGFKKNYWLAAGTLLGNFTWIFETKIKIILCYDKTGWFRDCSYIPHT